MEKRIFLTIGLLLFLGFQLSAKCLFCSPPEPCYWVVGECATSGGHLVKYCFDYNPETGQITPGRMQVLTDDKGNGVVQDGDRFIRILPDFLDSLRQLGKLSDKNYKEYKNFSNKVSQKRLKEIADEIGAKIVKVKKLPEPNYVGKSCTGDAKKEPAKSIHPFESVIIEMVCDCNPGNVLSTIITDPTGSAKITVPKKANYSFQLRLPPILLQSGISLASLSKGVVLNFRGAKNVEEVSFNAKGIAAAKNLPEGNYNLEVARKKPGGPKGQPKPPGPCPPGETPWLGGCIPIDVVQDVKIFCPSGKYDANGNCIYNTTNITENAGGDVSMRILPCPPNHTRGPLGDCIPNEDLPDKMPKDRPHRIGKSFGMVSFDLGYLVSTNSKNAKEEIPLFTGNGIDARVNYRYGKTFGIRSSLGFVTGKTNLTEIGTFAKKFEGNGLTSVTTGVQKNFSQFIVALGPSVYLGPKRKLEFYAQGGLGFQAKASKLKVDLYDAKTFVRNVYYAESKSLTPYWEVGGSYKLGNIKRAGVGFFGRFGSNGGTVGVNITMSDCRGAPCYRCPFPPCIPPPPPSEPTKPKGK
jgi:hypothetical protein